MASTTSYVHFAGVGLLTLTAASLTGCGLAEARRELGCEHSSDPAVASLCARIVPELHLGTVWTGRCGIPSFHWAYQCDPETVAHLICSGTFTQADARTVSKAETAELDSKSQRCLERLSDAFTAHAAGETPAAFDPGLQEIEKQCPNKKGVRTATTD